MKIAAIPTCYAGVNFRSRLEARWAAFFDLARWEWRYEPIDLSGWIPDFWVSFACSHSECGRWQDGKPLRDGTHDLLIEVKPIALDANEYELPRSLKDHPIAEWYGGMGLDDFDRCPLPCDGVAIFGVAPEHTRWCIVHGAGGGFEDVTQRVDDCALLWREAGNIVQWRPDK